MAKDTKEKKLTLKVENVLRLMHEEGSLFGEDSNDADIALITMGMRKFWRGKGTRINSGSGTTLEGRHTRLLMIRCATIMETRAISQGLVRRRRRFSPRNTKQ